MKVKTFVKVFCTICILTAILVTGLCVNAQRVANLSTTGYSSAPFATVCKDILIFSQNGKYGLMDYNGNVLVEPIYNDYLLPDEDGFVVFYECEDGLSKNSFRFDYYLTPGVLCNSVYDIYYYDFDEPYTHKYVKSADYNINSYVYNKSGVLICSAPNTYIASIGDEIIEIRTKPHSCGLEFVSLFYNVEYKRISDGSIVYSNDSCSASTSFNDGYAAISEGYDDSLSLTVINSAGEIISKKSETQILDETKYEYGFGEHHIRLFSDIHDHKLVFYFIDAPVEYEYYIYDMEKDYFKKFLGYDGGFVSFWSYNSNGFRRVFYNNSYKAVTFDYEKDEEYYYLGLLDNHNMGKTYKSLSVSYGTDIFLVETLDGRWGYIDTNGNELGFYKDATYFVNGKALVLDDENRAYIINDKLERISEYIYDVDGVIGISVKKDGLYYHITNFNEINGIPEITVTVNGNMVMFDQPPIIENGRTLVPLRAIFEALNATVEWNDATQTVTATKDGIVIKVQIGNNIMTKNGTQVPLDVPAKLMNGRTLVPARAVAEAFGAKVDWDDAKQQVIITK